MSTIPSNQDAIRIAPKNHGFSKIRPPKFSDLPATNKTAKNSPAVVLKLSASAKLSAAITSAPSVPSVVSSLSAINTYNNAANKKSVAAFNIVDSGQNILTNLDALQTLAVAGKVSSISFNDGTPKWDISASKYKSDINILAKLSSAIETVSFTNPLSSYNVTPGKTGGVTLKNKVGKDPAISLNTAKFLQFSDAKVIASSGNPNVDALLNIGTKYWWQGASPAALGTDNITTNLNSLDLSSSKHSINYSFMGPTKPALVTGTSAIGYAPMTQPQKIATREALAYLSTLINVNFTEVDNSAAADISFGQNTQTNSAGYANYPNANGSNPTAYLFLAKNAASNSQDLTTSAFNSGEYGWNTIIHEIGHTLGLKHPGNYNAGGGGTVGPYLPTITDNNSYSIMSYKIPVNSNSVKASGSQTSNSYSYSYSISAVNPSTYSLYDIAALQFLYGANDNTSTPTITATNNYVDFKTVWAPKGVQVDASSTTTPGIFDLRAGAFSSIAMKSRDAQISNIKTQLAVQGFNEANATAAATSIVKSVAKKPTSTNPLYDGLNNLALSYGSKYSEVNGGSADDIFYVSNYATSIKGGGGTNKVLLPGSVSDWTLNGLSQAISKVDSNVVVTLSNIQAIGYYNSATTSSTHSWVA